MAADDWYRELVADQTDSPLTAAELKELRAQLVLDRSARLMRRRINLWLKYSAIAIGVVSGVSQVQSWLVALISKLLSGGK